MVIGSIFTKIMIDKKEIQEQVRSAIETMLTFGEAKHIIINNLTLSINRFDRVEEDDVIYHDLFDVDFELRKKIYGKWELIETFWVCRYAGNHWDMVTKPWMHNLINDLTDCVMLHIEEPKKRGL